MPRPSLLASALVGYGAHLPDHPRKWWFHEKLRKGLGVNVEGEHVVNRGGLLWSLTPSDYCQSSLYWLGIKDQWELINLERLIPRDGIILDVGANFGYYSTRLAKRLSDAGHIHAIEPNPGNSGRLERNVSLNQLGGKVTIHRIGVSDSVGSVNMVDDPENTGHAIVTRDGSGYTIPTTTLDAFCASEQMNRLDAIILDVEGFEPRALRGGQETIQRHRPLIFIELWAPVMARQGTTVKEAADLLDGYGYRLFRTSRDQLIPLETLPEGDRGVNVFAFAQDRIPEELKHFTQK